MHVIAKNIKIVEPAGIFLEKEKALVVADLHIGYEAALEKQGIMMPKSQYQEIKETIKKMIDASKPKVFIILGDVKHEFGEATRQEWIEVMDLFNFLKSQKLKVVVVRGNHDNFLIPILKKLDIELKDPYHQLGGMLLFHGHKDIDLKIFSNASTLITAHEHPAIVVKDELEVKHKFKCFLKGKVYGKELIVLPALSPLMPGTEINAASRSELLSPILKVSDLSNFVAIVVEGNEVYEFPIKEIML